MATDAQEAATTEAASADDAQAAESFRLRVANLAWETEDESFKNFFKEYSPTEAVIIRRKRTNRSRGYGFVNFANEDDQKKALEALNGQLLDAREIKIAVSTSKGPYPEGSKKPQEAKGGDDEPAAQEQSAARLIVQRLNWNVTNKQLREAFQEFGECKAMVIKNRRSKRSRGYGFVTFTDEDSGKKALEALNGNEELGFEQGEGDEKQVQGIKVLEATSPGPRKRPARQRKRNTRKNDGDQDENDKPGPRRLFVRNLNEDTGEDALRSAFEGYGEIKNVRVVMDRTVPDGEEPKSKGIAFVTFMEHESFKGALEAFNAGGQIDGADVEVKRALPSRFIRNRNRGGGRGGGGTRGGDNGGGGGSGTAL